MTAADPSYSRRWLILAVVGVAQVMVVLHTTVVNIALPSTQRALHFSNRDRQWVITAYALAFGSLLPLGGRIGDLFGRKPTFLMGLIGFAAISAVGGLAQSFGWLVAALGRGASRGSPATIHPYLVMSDDPPVDDPDPMVAQLPRSALIIFGVSDA